MPTLIMSAGLITSHTNFRKRLSAKIKEQNSGNHTLTNQMRIVQKYEQCKLQTNIPQSASNINQKKKLYSVLNESVNIYRV